MLGTSARDASKLLEVIMQHPVPANRQQVEDEVTSIKAAVHDLCPIHMALERIVINSAGVVMACWQLTRGTSTSRLRSTVQVSAQLQPYAMRQLSAQLRGVTAFHVIAAASPCCPLATAMLNTDLCAWHVLCMHQI